MHLRTYSVHTSKKFGQEPAVNRPPKPPTGPNMPSLKHLIGPLYTLFAPLLVPLVPQHSIRPIWTPTWSHHDCHASFLMPSCDSLLPTGCHLMTTCPTLTPFRPSWLQFLGKSYKELNTFISSIFASWDAIWLPFWPLLAPSWASLCSS